jgi:beta-xylosidase
MYAVIYYVLTLLLCSAKEEIRPATEQIHLADPTVFHEEGKYYLYGTDGFNADSGFNAYVSEDMEHWSKALTGNQRALTKGASFGTKGFWAPQVFRHHNQYYMAYTANEHIAIANSDSPAGQFKQTPIKAIDADVKQIDPFVFKDDDGKLYLYHVRLQNGNRIFVAELKSDLSGILPNTLRECISAVNNPQAWENTQQVKWTVTEGPTVIKRGNLYYMLYSANDFRNPDYAVGYAVADNPYGPWKKYEGNPIISKKVTGANGSGHGDIVRDKAGDYYYVFHTHFSNEKVAPRKTAMIKIKFTDDGNSESMKADTLSFKYLKYGR